MPRVTSSQVRTNSNRGRRSKRPSTFVTKRGPLLVAIAFAYWELGSANEHLFWFVIGFGVFAVIAMWVFPEAVGKGKGGGSKT